MILNIEASLSTDDAIALNIEASFLLLTAMPLTLN